MKPHADKVHPVIADATAADSAGISACIATVARERTYLATTDGFPVESTRNFLVDVLARGGVYLVVKAGPEVAGWCDVTPGSLEGFRHRGRLGMGLLPAYRSRGFGTALLTRAVARSTEVGLEKVELEVFASNLTAIRLYERHGFKLEGRKVRGRKLDGRYDDLLQYGLLLRSPA